MMCVAVVVHHVSWSFMGICGAYCQPAVMVVEMLMQPVRSSYHIKDTPRNRCLADLMRTPRVVLLSSGTHETLLENG